MLQLAFLMIALVPLFLLWFLPALVGLLRNHHQAFAILMLDIFLGWTILGWIVALVWAFSSTPGRARPHATDAAR